MDTYFIFPKNDESITRTFQKETETSMKLYLYEYSLKLGAIFTYQLIQSIKNAQQRPELDLSKKDQIIAKWVEKVINPLSILESFSHLCPVYKRMQRPRENASSFRPSFFELQNVKIAELEKIFENIFPELFKDLEKIKHSDEVAGRVEWAKDHALELVRLEKLEKKMERLKKEDPNHVKCKGKLESMLFVHNDGQFVKRCSKCRRWIPVGDYKP